MKLKSGDFSIPCKVGDNIEFELYPSGTEHAVQYALGDETSPLPENETFGLRCDIETYKCKPLSIIFNFSEPEGGTYELRAKSQNGSIGSYTIDQPHGSRIRIIRFGLEGDPVTSFD